MFPPKPSSHTRAAHLRLCLRLVFAPAPRRTSPRTHTLTERHLRPQWVRRCDSGIRVCERVRCSSSSLHCNVTVSPYRLVPPAAGTFTDGERDRLRGVEGRRSEYEGSGPRHAKQEGFFDCFGVGMHTHTRLLETETETLADVWCSCSGDECGGDWIGAWWAS